MKQIIFAKKGPLAPCVICGAGTTHGFHGTTFIQQIQRSIIHGGSGSAKERQCRNIPS
jgi:hypothetical protein